MQNGIHFIAGLPRSGSTLLSALLLQNPALHASISSPVGGLLSHIQRGVSQGNEAAVFIDDGQRKSLLRGIFENYYYEIGREKTIIDTNRGWTGKLNLLAELFPKMKVICCVRHIPWIIDSVETLLRRNSLELSKIFDFDPNDTVYGRAEGLMARAGMIGFALAALKQAMHSAESHHLLLLPYETLARQPAHAMSQIYDFLELPHFSHDFEHIAFDAAEFDARLGTPGLHSIRPAARLQERETILPPDLWNRYATESIWRDPAFNTRNVRVVA